MRSCDLTLLHATHTCPCLRWLREDPDGLFRPVSTFWEERPSTLVNVRTQFMPNGPLSHPGGEAGWKLLTLRSKLLDIDWLDKVQ